MPGTVYAIWLVGAAHRQMLTEVTGAFVMKNMTNAPVTSVSIRRHPPAGASVIVALGNSCYR